MSDRPVFMSPQHVAILNAGISVSAPVAQLCSGLDRDLVFLYELSDGPDGTSVYWQTRFSRSGGIRFSLDQGPDAPDVRIIGSYWDILDAIQGKGSMPLPLGDEAALKAISTLLTSKEVAACAVPAEFPVRPPASVGSRT